MVRSVNGVVIWTENLERLLPFYRDTLGLTPHSVRPDFVSFKWGEMRLGLGRHDQVSGEAEDPYRVMVNFHVDNIHQEHVRLSAAGVRFIRPPEKEHWGGGVSTLADPDGNILQLLQQPDSSTT